MWHRKRLHTHTRKQRPTPSVFPTLSPPYKLHPELADLVRPAGHVPQNYQSPQQRDHRRVPPWQLVWHGWWGSKIKIQALMLTQAFLSTEPSLQLTVSLLLVSLTRHKYINFRVKCKMKMLGSCRESVVSFKMVVAREKARCKLFWAYLAAEGTCLWWWFWSHGTLWVFLFRLA